MSFKGTFAARIRLCGLLLALPVGSVQAQSRPAPQTIQAVFEAIRNNDTNALRQAYQSDTNCLNDDYYAASVSQRFPLLEAAAAGQADMVALLLTYGADPNVAGDTTHSVNAQRTPLDNAVQSGSLETCKRLLQAGANPNHASFSQDTALHFVFDSFWGAHSNRTEIAELLLDYGGDPFREAGYYKYTPLELNITRGDGRLTARMLGQDKAHPPGGKAVIKPGTRHKREPAGIPAGFLDGKGPALLSAAVQREELEAVQALLKAGVKATNNDPGAIPLLHTLALTEGPTVTGWDVAKGTIAQFKSVPTVPGGAVSGQDLAELRRQQVREVLIHYGADYDVFAATGMGDQPQVKKLLRANPEVHNARDRDGQTPLHWAVLANRPLLTSFWIQHGTGLDVTNVAGQTALHLAAAKGLPDQVAILLAAGAATGLHDTNGWTPLDTAIQGKQTACIRLLLADKSAPIHAERGIRTPLHQAAADGNVAALVALTETATNLEVRDELGFTPLELAVQHGHLAAAALLLDQGADINARDPEGNSLLLQMIARNMQLFIADRPPAAWFERLRQDPHKAVYLTNLVVDRSQMEPPAILQAASFLLAYGINVQATNQAGQSALQLAADEKTALFGERAELLKLLGTGGARTDERDADGNTPLHLAGKDTTGDRVAGLIAAGADINATNHLGQTPLHLFAANISAWVDNANGGNEPFQLLVKSGANLNAQDQAGRTALHMLAMTNHSYRAEAVQLLLRSGANPNLRDKYGRTPAQLFLANKWPWTDVQICVAMLFKAGADLSARDEDGKTVLHYFAGLGTESPLFFMRGIENTLLAAKLDVNARDNEGNTPLHIAAQTKTGDVYNWLVQQGADQNATNDAGQTPRSLSARTADGLPRPGLNPDSDIFSAARDGRLDWVKPLVQADPSLATMTNRFGQTALSLAAAMHHTNVVMFLAENGARMDLQSAVSAHDAKAVQDILDHDPGAVKTGHWLNTAATVGDLATVKVLVAGGGDLKGADLRGLSPLGDALLNRHPDVADFLRQQGAGENLMDAIYLGDAELVATLLKGNKLPAAADGMVRSPLAAAAGIGRVEIVQQLLDSGADAAEINPRNGMTPLHLAAECNQTNIARLLIRHGAKVNIHDRMGWSPLHRACVAGKVAMVAMLVRNNAEVNDPTQSAPVEAMGRMPFLPGPGTPAMAGNRPLHLAASAGQVEVVKLLLRLGASVNATNAQGLTPLDVTFPRFNTPDLFQLRRGQSVAQTLFGPVQPYQQMNLQSLQADRQAVAGILEQAGGKRSGNQPSFNGPSGGRWGGPPW